MKRNFIIISIALLFLANVSVMYYRNYEGFAKLTKEEKAVEKINIEMEKYKKNETVKKFILAQCKLTDLDEYDLTEECSTSIPFL